MMANAKINPPTVPAGIPFLPKKRHPKVTTLPTTAAPMRIWSVEEDSGLELILRRLNLEEHFCFSPTVIKFECWEESLSVVDGDTLIAKSDFWSFLESKAKAHSV